VGNVQNPVIFESFSQPYVMAAIAYYVFLYPLSLMPWRVLYFFSDVLYLVMFHLVGYRKKVVWNNLSRSFPEKATRWKRSIMKAFYRQFCDNLLESVKLLSVSKASVEQRMQCENPEVLNAFYDKGQDVAVLTGHYYSWELWFLAIDAPIRHQAVLIYKPLANAFFEKVLFKIRKSFGTLPIPMANFSSFVKSVDQPIAVIFGADQSHPNVERSFWTTFLQQETGVVFGPEKFAVERDAAVVFCRIKKHKRGFYSFRYETLISNPKNTDYGEVTLAHVQHLESIITEEPQGWLWSHKRWKRKRPDHMPLH